MNRAVIPVVVALLALVACDRMANQPKERPYEAYRDQRGNVAPVTPPMGTIARDWAPDPKPPVLTESLLARGRERFNIDCAPCHGRRGDGHGMVVERGFPAPPSYHNDRLRGVPVQHFYDVITHGYGVMFSYAQRVTPDDRWAIAAYIRAFNPVRTCLSPR